MEYLSQFLKELSLDQVPIRDKYIDQTNDKIHEKQDVVTDLNDSNCWSATACLPIARQIVVLEKKMCITVPKLGDLFVGIVHHSVIEKVTFIINNYSEEISIPGTLRQIGSLMLWQFTEVPVILMAVEDYEHVNIQLQIELNNQYSLHASNQEVFKACYGYFHPTVRHVVSQIVYQIPLLNPQYTLEIICGVWTITSTTSKAPSVAL